MVLLTPSLQKKSQPDNWLAFSGSIVVFIIIFASFLADRDVGQPFLQNVSVVLASMVAGCKVLYEATAAAKPAILAMN